MQASPRPAFAGGQDAAHDERALLATALASVAMGDAAALERIYARTSAKLFGICLRILPDRHQAEEALQETYLSIWRRAEAFDATRGTAMTWLMTLARNCAIDRRRAVARTSLAPLEAGFDPVDPAPGPDAVAIDADDRRHLLACIERLEELDRGFIASAFFEGASYPELAARATMPLPTVKSRIRRALIKLRECLT